jgi:putative PIN family toxin of toxin-antitoxin system
VIVAVLDTNVLVSGIAGITRPGSTPGQIVRRWRLREFTLVVSEPILTGVQRTLGNPYFASRLSSGEVTEILTRLRADALVQPITAHVAGLATHPEDDAILATATNAGANCLVTGDKALLALGSVEEIAVLTPRQFLDRLQDDDR